MRMSDYSGETFRVTTVDTAALKKKDAIIYNAQTLIRITYFSACSSLSSELGT